MKTQVRLRAAVVAFAVGLSGCADMSEFFSYGDAAEHAEVRAQAEEGQLWEMTIMAGRYGVMLGQVRDILKLPAPRNDMSFPTDAEDDAKKREDLARYQASVTAEFLADASVACKRKRVPRDLRKMACEQHAKWSAETRAPVKPDIQTLAMRNDRVGEFIMPWWDAVCATAPKPREGDVPACAME
ncbi:MAG: hypothetical protein ACKVRO_18345 [Micropepsaceae bacterium]